MKKTAALLLTAFYLLLTTGMFVCAMHCTVAKLAPPAGMHMAGIQGKCCCQKNKARGCSRQHASFVIKENVKPGYQIRFTQPFLTVQPAPFRLPGIESTIPVAVNLFNGSHSPPGLSGKSIVIQHRSFLI